MSVYCIWLCNNLTLTVPEEGYSRHVSYTLNYMSTFYKIQFLPYRKFLCVINFFITTQHGRLTSGTFTTFDWFRTNTCYTGRQSS